jgi:hypothetical protein
MRCGPKGILTLLMCLQRKGARPIRRTESLNRHETQTRRNRVIRMLDNRMANFVFVVHSLREQILLNPWNRKG